MSKKFRKKSLIPMVFNNLGRRIPEMGQKHQNNLFLGQIGDLAQKQLILTFLAHFQKCWPRLLYTVGISDFFLNFLDKKNQTNFFLVQYLIEIGLARPLNIILSSWFFLWNLKLPCKWNGNLQSTVGSKKKVPAQSTNGWQ